ncbi:MAG: insulinase family protein [Thermoanaerobaculales bacterium]|nr:insulinase family protein [Thermoanaerobaculales bacterium]
MAHKGSRHKNIEHSTAFELIDRAGGVAEWRHRENGLTLLVAPTAVAPVASLGVVYRVGSRNEVAGHTGATHMLEHLMFKGTRRFNRADGTEIARVLQRVGAAFNATTWLDRTNYYATLPVEHLELAAEVEADRMGGALLSDEDLASERSVVLNELDRGENEPFDLLLKGVFAHAYRDHPYRHPTIGLRHDVESMTGEILRGFYDTFYHPDNATVIVTGDVGEDEVLQMLAKHFGRAKAASAPPPRVEIREGPQREERRFSIHKMGELGHLAFGWHIPRGLHEDLAALLVLGQILAEGVTSRLHQRLVETNFCLGIHAAPLELHDPGLFQVFTTLAPGIPHAQVEAVVREETHRLACELPANEEIARARIQTRTDLAFRRESPSQLLSVLSEAVAMGDWRAFVQEMDRVARLKATDVSRVCETHLVDDNLTVGWFVPENSDHGGQG